MTNFSRIDRLRHRGRGKPSERKVPLMRQTVRINVADGSGGKHQILESRSMRLPQRRIRLLFGDFSQILVLTLPDSVESIEIRKMKGGAAHEIPSST